MKNWNSLMIAILYFSLSACASTSQSDEKLPLVVYCDLVKSPSQFDGQAVRVKASHIVGFEWSYLAGEKCSSDSTDTARTWIVIPDDAWGEGVRECFEILLKRC